MKFGRQRFLFSLGLIALPFVFLFAVINDPNFSNYSLKIALKIARIRTGIRISAESWHLNPLWFNAELENVSYEHDALKVSIPKLRVQVSPLSLLILKLHIYKVDLEKAQIAGKIPSDWLNTQSTNEEWKKNLPAYSGKFVQEVYAKLKDNHIELEQINLFSAESRLEEIHFNNTNLRAQLLKDGQGKLEWQVQQLTLPGKLDSIHEFSGALALLKESKRNFFLSLRRFDIQISENKQNKLKASGRMPGLLRAELNFSFQELNDWLKLGKLSEKYSEKSKVGGFFNFDIQATLGQSSYENIDGEFQGENIHYQGYRLARLSGSIESLNAGAIQVKNLQIQVPRSHLDPQDSKNLILVPLVNILDNKLSGEADIQNLGICSLLDATTVDECWAAFHFSGKARFEGSLKPFLLGLETKLQTSSTRVGSEPLKTSRGNELLFVKPAVIEAGADVGPEQLNIRKGTIKWSDKSQAFIEGKIFYKPAVVDLTVDSKQIEVDEALDTFLNLHYSGRLQTNTKIFYSFFIPKEKGRTTVLSNVQIFNVAIEKQVLGNASGSTNYQSNQLFIGPIELKQGGGKALIQGHLGKNNDGTSQLKIDIDANRIDLSGTLPSAKSPFISGLVSGQARFQGALTQSNKEKYFGGPIQAQLENVILFGVNLQKAKVSARYDDKVLYFDEILAEKDRRNVWIKGLLHPVSGSRIDFRSDPVLVKNIGYFYEIERIFVDSQAKIDGFWSPKDGWEVRGDVSQGHVAHGKIPAGKFLAKGQDNQLEILADFEPALYYRLLASPGTDRLSPKQLEIRAQDNGILAGMAYLKGWTGPSDVLTEGKIDLLWTPERGHLFVDSLQIKGPNGFENKFENLVNVQSPLRAAWVGDRISENSGWSDPKLPVTISGAPGERAFGLKAQLPMALFDSLIPGSQKIYTGIATLEAKVPISPYITSVQGRGQLKDVGLLLPGVGRPLQELTGNFVLSDSRFILPQGKAKLGSGNVDFRAEYLIDLRKPGVVLDATLIRGQILVQEDIPMEISGDLSLRGDSFPYLLSGRLIVANGLYSREFNQPTATNILQKDPKPKHLVNYNIDLEVASNFEIKNSVINAPVTGRLTMLGKDSTPQLLGFFDLNRGIALAKENEFQIAQAHVELPREVGQPSQVFMRAFTNINYLSQNYRVEMNVRGPSNNLAFEFTSDPPLPNADIINLLAFGTLRENSDSIGNKTSVETAQYEALQALFGQAIGKSINKNTGFDVRVSSSRDLSQKSTIPKVTVQRRLSKNITATFGRSLDASKPERNLQVDYKVLNNVNLTGVWESPTPEKSSTGVDLRFKFDVK